jgi:predicted dehydrogenase
MIGVGLVGFGHWGPNIARNLVAAGARLAAVSDVSAARLAAARARFSNLSTSREWRALVDNPAVAAVVVATPATTHYAIAAACLEAGKHVLIEKPMTATSREARRLVALAAKRGLVLMVDHTFLYTAGIATVARALADGALGEINTYESVRTGPPAPSHDVDAVWDLAVHDLAILDHLFGVPPQTVAAKGTVRPPLMLVDDARLTLTFASGLIAKVHVSWRAKTKTRRIRIRGTRGSVIYDEMARRKKVEIRTLGSRGANNTSATGDGSEREPLAEVAREFLDCIGAGRAPRSNGAAGLRAVELLEVASASLKEAGRALPVAAKAVS